VFENKKIKFVLIKPVSAGWITFLSLELRLLGKCRENWFLYAITGAGFSSCSKQTE
jgi:hypothetical protein